MLRERKRELEDAKMQRKDIEHCCWESEDALRVAKDTRFNTERELADARKMEEEKHKNLEYNNSQVDSTEQKLYNISHDIDGVKDEERLIRVKIREQCDEINALKR